MGGKKDRVKSVSTWGISKGDVVMVAEYGEMRAIKMQGAISAGIRWDLGALSMFGAPGFSFGISTDQDLYWDEVRPIGKHGQGRM